MVSTWKSAAVLAATLTVTTAFAVGTVGTAAAASLGARAAVASAQAPPRPTSTSTSTKTSSGAKAATAGASGYPVTPPAQICGSSILNGPATQPAGSVRVDPSQNLFDVTNANPPQTTFWLSPGTFTLGTGVFGQVIPKDGDTYIGAPGAILDGQNVNYDAFTQKAANVTLEYFTIQNFAALADQAVVNHDFGNSWTIQYMSIKNNTGDGANAGSNSLFQYNCISSNGQSGINGVTGITTVTIDHNELGFNGGVASSPPESCGCKGNVKLFGSTNVVITNNWVHDAGSQGLWADTNAVGWLIQGNYINNSFGEAIVIETSYNAFIHNNNILNNSWGKGQEFNARNDSFPIATVYISESGGDSRVYGGKYSTLEVSGNNFDNNWGGVTLWEDPNRFCNTPGNTAPGFCPIAGAATPALCTAPTISLQPYYNDCRWRTQNVLVDNNTFREDTDLLNCPNFRCADNSIFSTIASSPGYSPYLGDKIEQAITYNQNNHFMYNTYIGNWNFDTFQVGTFVNWETWKASPSSQDTTSTLTRLPSANALDADTSNLEGSIGHWSQWFSTTVAQTTAQAHNGTHSLQVNITAANGWGVQLNNYPFYEAYPGSKVLTFWGMTTSGSGLGVTMQVTWLDRNLAPLQVDNVTIAALTSSWQQGLLMTNAPPGTSSVNVTLLNSTGGPGQSVFVDDLVVADNAADNDTATIEGSTGHWTPWFSSSIAQSTAQAVSGTHSLQVNIAAQNGWGVTLNNYPYFVETPGTKTLSFWARAGTGSALAVTLQATWRDAYGNILQTDKVSTATMTSTWQQAFTVVTAPPGTEYVGLDLYNSTGKAGDSLYVDNVLAINGVLAAMPPPPPPNPNAVDTDTSTLEASIGQWVPWFSDTIAQSSSQAHTGTHSLLVSVTAANGWGVTLKNSPYFAITPGTKVVSFWGRAGSGSGRNATMRVVWRDASGAALQTDNVTIPALTLTWQQATASVTAPAGTVHVEVDLIGTNAAAGNWMFFDDVAVTS